MPLLADRVKETTTTTGTGTLTLLGALAGFRTFTAAFGSGASVYYVIAGGGQWEVGAGTTGTGTLARNTVYASSNAGALVNFSAGTKEVFCSYVGTNAVTTIDAATLTNKTISGASNTLSNIANGSLTNSAVTVNGTSISLGASGTVTAAAGTLTGATLNSTVTGSSLTSVGTLTSGAIGAGFTAIANTALANSAVTVNGTAISLGGTGTVTAAAGTLTGATLNSTVTASSLTSVGTLTALSMGGTITMTDNQIVRPRLSAYSETYATPAITTNTLTLNLQAANTFRVARNANITTLTISNPAASGNVSSFTLIFDANGTGYTITWPASVKWPAGAAPTITTTAGRSDMFVFYTNNGGTTWYAMTAAQNFVTT